MILVDSSVWIDFLNGRNTVHRHILHELIEANKDIGITEIIVTEILQGIKEERDFLLTQEYLLAFPIFTPLGIETYLHAARIFRECRKAGKTVRKTVDCMIAAICIEHNLTLLHNDRDFNRIAECSGLRNWPSLR